ncbi:MAG: nucleotidyltransferase family protein [Clostridia bacterium]|nr:nucleotidyltransferase family protein [Clostridia bacterium]
MMNEKLLKVIRYSLWHTETAVADRSVYDEMVKHAIAILPATVLSSLSLPEKLFQEWESMIYQQIAYNANCRHVQKDLPVKVPFVILKGTSAAKYYPNPVLRTLGDIDIIPRREDFETAYEELLNAGYRIEKELGRETCFVKDGIMVELHRSFAKLNNPSYAEYLDDLIIENINPTHVLPDIVNGLVLLEHISQHLVRGLGLRQIIDWMMFVNKCLPEEQWEEFREMAKNIGLDTLAITLSRMCEIFLGLPRHAWCEGANEEICNMLMEYILSCGNFGNNRMTVQGLSENVLIYARNPVAFFKLLQSSGMERWKPTEKYFFIRPFAWVYQAGRYVKRGLSQKNSLKSLKAAFSESRKRKKMFDFLGVRQDSKGLTVYKDGVYIKEKTKLFRK